MALSAQKLADAVKFNATSGRKTGWMDHYEQALAALGFPSMSPTAERLAQAVADFQAKNSPPLGVDGKLGSKTWAVIRQKAGIVPQIVSDAASEPLNVAGTGPLWMRIAQYERNEWNRQIATMTSAEQGAAEANMTRDEEYFLASPYFGGRVKDIGTVPRNQSRADWCAAFVNWCLHRAGFSHTGSAGAHSFVVSRLWHFEALEEPRQGCVTVVGSGSRGAHVAFIWDWDNLPNNPRGDVAIAGHRGRRLGILGGNQGQRITIKDERRKMLSTRGQNGVTSPYLWPLQGSANCDHAPATERPHFAGQRHSG